MKNTKPNLFSRFLLLIIFGASMMFAGCSKSKSGSSASYYFKGNMDGSEIVIEAGPDTYDPRSFHYDVETIRPGGSTIESTQGCAIRHSEKGLTISVHIVEHLPVNYTDAQKLAMFALGQHPFGFQEQNFGQSQPGVVIIFSDNEKTWYSELGPHSAGDDKFEIVSLTDWNESNARKLLNVRFNCTLYDEEGNSIRLTNATFQGHVLSQF